MSINLKSAALAVAILGSGALGVSAASAAPLGAGFDPAIASGSDLTPMAQDARWVCGPFRCRWAPNFYRPAPRFFYPRPRRWRRWW